ncbi:hypothetical protein [Pseudophaeobacter sp. EL27]|uniref:hypothetical protein n=1 Tax=Pseudophaeobacter sp. EL27 TaxID=2107580 RepID=UPI0013C4B277|nr:hypothetical protein [Pseudophaeobacter sp. EL27]
MIANMIVSKISSFNKWLNAQAGWFRAVFIPFILSALNLLILLFWRDLPAVTGFILLGVYVIGLFFLILVNYENTGFIDRTNSERKLEKLKLEKLNAIVSEKTEDYQSL